MELKNIAFVISSLNPGGAERVVSELANTFVNEYEVSIITLVKTKPFYRLDPEVTLLSCSDKIRESHNPVKSIHNGLARVATLHKHLKQRKIQLVVSFMTTSNIYAIWACKFRGIPCIISERANHDVLKLSKMLVYIRDFSYRFAKYLVVQTQGNKKFYEKNLKSDKIVIIENPIGEDLKQKRILPKKNNTEKTILNVGSFKLGKAQNLLISAFSAIPNEGWRLVFAGDGPTKNEYISLAKTLRIAKKINFIGNKPNIHDYYNEADLFVFTSEHEGFPNALMEALFFGLPSISTNCPHGPSDLIKDGENGFLIPVGDQKKLEQQMLILMNDKKLQDEFSKKAMASTQRLHIEVIEKKWRKYIDQII